ncbi:hypothetical protein KBX73_10225 [Acetobacter persici]|uniref:hypothetical protein n=1 Tax=Acetobacter persici TaxID=1076596 RepID=UPI0020CEE1D1|nr:hypothetical protein [Acetobacter persici]MCP9320141.1 hypothetical protein [Acetobacter persici]
MIKRLSFVAALVLPSVAFAQTAVPIRPNHTLPQYGAVTAANSNAGASRAMLRMATPPAGSTYAALWPPGGLRKDTRVPSLYADGSAGTLEQVGRMADGSVQQTDIGTTVAGLADGRVTSPLAGDASAAPVLAAGAVTSRTLAQRAADTLTTADNGDTGQGSAGDAAAISALLARSPSHSEIVVPSGNVPDSGSIVVPPGKAYVMHYSGGNADSSRFMGDGNIAEGVSNGRSLYRYVAGNLNFSANFFSQFENRYSGPSRPEQNNVWLYSTTGVDHNFNQISGYQGNTSSLRVDLNSFSRADEKSFDIGLQSNVYRHGTAWGWGNLSVVEELTGEMLLAHNTQEYVGEWDLSGFGNDDPASLYNPMAASRHGFLFSTWNSGGGYGQPWQAGHNYKAGDAIEATIDGVLYSFIATKGGASGAAAPGLTVTADPDTLATPDTAHAVTDGTVQWAFNGRMLMQISCMVCVSYQPDMQHPADRGLPSDPRTGKRIPVAFGTIVSSDAPVYNAGIDFSVLKYIRPVHIVLRTQADSYLDLTGDGTSAGQNMHLLGYDSAQKALTYKVNGVPVLSVKESGAVISSAPAQLPVMTRAQIRAYPSPAKGMQIYDSDDDTPAVYTGAGWKLMSLSALPAN